MREQNAMIIANPGIDCKKEINISWHTGLDNKGSYLEYREIGEKDWKKVFPTISKVDCFNNVYSVDKNRNDIREEVIFLHCKVYLKNLKVNTNYEYRIDSSEERHYFKTSPKAEFSFIWISDFHSYPPAVNR